MVRTDALSRLHEALWAEIAPLGTGVSQYYEPERWLPHITLAHGDLTPSGLGSVLSHLAAWDFSWEVRVDNLAIIHDIGEGQVLHSRFDFVGT